MAKPAFFVRKKENCHMLVDNNVLKCFLTQVQLSTVIFYSYVMVSRYEFLFCRFEYSRFNGNDKGVFHL